MRLSSLRGLLLLCLAAWLPVAADGPPAEVVIVGTQHFITDMPEGYTPGHLRALLARIRPDVVALEAPTNAADPWASLPYEAWNVTRPWADAHKILTAPVGWDVPDYSQRLGRMFQEIQGRKDGAALGAELQAHEARFQREVGSLQSMERMNDAAYRKLWKDYHAVLHRLYGKDTPWEEWNARIADNLLALCRKHPGKRITVVFGAAHAYFLEDTLKAVPGVVLLPVEGFLPLDPQEVEREMTPLDELKALRLLNFGQLDPSILPALERHLGAVGRHPELQGDYLLFRGKLLLHRRKPQEALVEFRKLGESDPKALSAFDATTRLMEAGLVYAALALGQMGKTEEARAELKTLEGRPGLSPATLQWVRQLLAAP